MKDVLSTLGPVCAVIGAQWGDEGKGKIVDMLAEHYDVIARACGGANAGHTIVVNGKKHVFHLLPSGCLHEGKQVVIGSGVVIHLPTLLEEIAVLRQAGIDVVPRLSISHAAHIVFNFHKDIDGALEERRTKAKGEGIGTTKRGIGPAYMDKAARTGIRMERLGEDLTKELKLRTGELQATYGVAVDVEKEINDLADAQSIIGSRITDTAELLYGFREEGKAIIIEGAQASLLDIDHGTYPFVTSSSTTAAGALQGIGLAPRSLTSCIGVAKAYCTRVGGGPFPTEAEEEVANRIRERGGEYGATTKRPRRCGWLSLADLHKAARINGFTHWNITKLDVLDQEDTIPVALEEKQGKPTYKEFAGWKESTEGITKFEKLPKNAQSYIEFIEEQTHVPASFIGTGQGREQMIVRA